MNWQSGHLESVNVLIIIIIKYDLGTANLRAADREISGHGTAWTAFANAGTNVSVNGKRLSISNIRKYIRPWNWGVRPDPDPKARP